MADAVRVFREEKVKQEKKWVLGEGRAEVSRRGRRLNKGGCSLGRYLGKELSSVLGGAGACLSLVRNEERGQRIRSGWQGVGRR